MTRVEISNVMRGMDSPSARLRWAREQKYRSGAEAARALGMGTSTYNAHENGQNSFDFKQAVGSLVDPSIQLPRDEADQIERLTMHLYFRAAIEALGVLAIAAYCLLVLFTALNESPF